MDHINIMQGLAQKVRGLTAIIPQDKDIVFLDYPVHLNVGDLMITAGTKRFFKYGKYKLAHEFSFMERQRCLKFIRPEHTIVMSGGGNFGDLWHGHQEFREWAVETFPDNKIVVLPQSVHFISSEAQESSLTALNKHKDLTICVRDLYSQEALLPFKNIKVHLCPDMAHNLWPSVRPHHKATNKSPLLLIREDLEAEQEKQAKIYDHRSENKAIDWLSIVGKQHTKIYSFLRRGLYTSKYSSPDQIPRAFIWNVYASYLIRKSVAYFDKHPSITTDRLHGCLLGLLLQKPVTLFDSGYGKVSRYADCWLKDTPLLTQPLLDN